MGISGKINLQIQNSLTVAITAGFSYEKGCGKKFNYVINYIFNCVILE